VHWRRILAGAVAVALLIPNSSVLEHRAIIAVFLLCLLTGRARQFVRDWAPLVAIAAAFVLLRQLATLSPFPPQGERIAQIEAGLFAGTLPSAWLQAHLYVPGRPGALAYAATAVHASYFFGFVVVGLGTWLAARRDFGGYTRLLGITFALGLLGYVLCPAEPPWLIARDGGDPASAQRIIGETARGTRLTAGIVAAGQAWQSDPDALGDPNPTAAMPSVHTAVTVALAIFLSRRHWALGALGWLYAVAMAFALVYLGEHFVLDVVAGVVCAVVAAGASGVLRRDRTDTLGAAAPRRPPADAGRCDMPCG
jgi:membrane-associated phospholipid phosphatase